MVTIPHIASDIYKDLFQSTPPVWVVTDETIDKALGMDISIHTTRVGGDLS